MSQIYTTYLLGGVVCSQNKHSLNSVYTVLEEPLGNLEQYI